MYGNDFFSIDSFIFYKNDQVLLTVINLLINNSSGTYAECLEMIKHLFIHC